ncbi:MAG: alpha/beta hydrolase [Rhodospirillales bacterium]|nr:alpha/beta hydrolase [Rhodospirillales bacterium]
MYRRPRDRGKWRCVFLALAVVVVLFLLAAGSIWLRHGESVTVLGGLLTAAPGVVPDTIERRDVMLTVDDGVLAFDVYEPDEATAVLVLVPGLTPAGRDDERVIAVAGVLAGSGFRTVVPELPGATRFRTDAADAAVLASVIDHVVPVARQAELPTVVVAISYGQGPALVALAGDRGDLVDAYLGLGGYYDALSVVRFTTTGAIGAGADARIGEPDPRARWILLLANAPLVSSPEDRWTLDSLARDAYVEGTPSLTEIAAVMAVLQPDARALLAFAANTDPARVEPLLADLDPSLRAGMMAVSPILHDLSGLEGKIILVHGDADPIVPCEESVRLAEAVPGSTLFVVPGFSHIESEATGVAGQIAMVRAVTALLDLRSLP